MCIHCSLRKQKCRLKSATTNGWWHFGQSEQRKASVLFPVQSEKSPDSGFFACDLLKNCIKPSSRITDYSDKGREHYRRLSFLQINGSTLFNRNNVLSNVFRLVKIRYLKVISSNNFSLAWLWRLQSKMKCNLFSILLDEHYSSVFRNLGETILSTGFNSKIMVT